MAYQIPQQLEYKEKILFGLTFEQLAIAGIFSLPAIALLLGTPFPIATRVFLALIPVSLACLCMFSKLPHRIKALVKWLRYKEIKLYDENSEISKKMQEFIPIKDIKDKLILKENKVAIIQVTPTNFAIKNENEQEAITNRFQKFLNSLSFPLQILIRTETVNLDRYLANLEETCKERYQGLMQDFKSHMNNTISSKGLLNRVFYLVIPEKADSSLGIQVPICQKLLTNLNIKHKILKEEEILLTLNSFFHNQFEEQQTNKNFLYDNIAPQKIINNKTELLADQTYIRTIVVKGYPRTVEQGFLDKLITLNGNIEISLHTEPYSIEKQIVMLNRELQKQRADLWSMKRKEIINPSLEIQFEDTKRVLESLQKGDDRLFDFSLYVACKANSIEKLEILSKKVESELNSLLMIPHCPKYEQHLAYKSVLPLGMDSLKIKRNITSSALSAFFPFTSQFLEVDDTGILLGLNRNKIPIIKDIYKLFNYNGCILASSGGGKSYTTKLMIARLLLRGIKVIVIDPQAEYVELVKQFNGQLITISKNSDTIINPLDLMGHDFDEKKLNLLELMPIMLDEMSEIQKAVMDKALTACYETAGITNDKKTWHNRPPVLGDLLKQLKQMSKVASRVEIETYRSLINRLEMYVSGVFSFLNRQTKLNFENSFVCFNIKDMPNQVKPTIMFLVLDYIYQKMQSSLEKMFVCCDEFSLLLKNAEKDGFLFRIVKTGRKFNLALLLITQNVDELLANDVGKALLNNSEYTFLFRQKPSIIDKVQKTFLLSTSERERLLSSSAGEGILIIGDEHTEITVIASPEEHKVITTNPNELLAKKVEIIEEYEETDLDYGKRFFKRKNLTEKKVEGLLAVGYIRSLHIGLYGGRKEEYLLKPSPRESAEHFFVVKAIEEYLLKYTSKVELFETKDADIVFEVNGKKMAIEVETGTNLAKQPKKFEKKIDLLKNKYGDVWYIVITNWELREKYQKYGKVLVRKEVPAVLKKLYFQGSNSVKPELENGKF